MALIDKASLLMVPSTYEAGTLYNVLPSGNRAPDSTDQNSGYDQTRADFTFDRGSNAAATRVNADGLIEKYRENLLLQSNQFDTTWYNSNSTETGGQADKDGGTDAWLLTKTSTNGGIRQNNTTSGVQTFSFYAKAGDSNWVKVNNLGSSAYHQANFDLVNGVVGTTAYIIDAKIEDVGNGWFRCITTYNTTLVNIDVRVADSDNVVSGTSGSIYIQSAQLETGLVATDYLDSGATTAKAGVLIDLPRINYDANGENGALLLEPSRTNKFSFSEYFGASDWLKSGNGSGSAPVITDNYAISPEGVKNAARVQFDAVGTAATDRSTLAQRFAFTTGDVYTISCWVKATTGNSTMFHFRANGAQVGGEQIATDEWKLFKATHTATATTTDDYGMQIRGTYSSNTSDILIYGMQLENASYNTSYIPNHGTSGGVTRAADDCEIDGDSSLFGQTEGTLFYEFSVSDYDSSENAWISIDDGSSSNRILIYSLDNEQGIRAQAKNNGTIFLQSNLKTLTSGDKVKAALAYKGDDSVFYVNGSSITLSTWLGGVSFSNPVDRITLNYGGYSSYKNYQTLVFKTRLSNEELATLTTL